MRVALPILPLLLRIAAALPGVIRAIDADVKEAHGDKTPGGEKVTPAEVAVIVGHVFERLGEAVLPAILKANGL